MKLHSWNLKWRVVKVQKHDLNSIKHVQLDQSSKNLMSLILTIHRKAS